MPMKHNTRLLKSLLTLCSLFSLLVFPGCAAMIVGTAATGVMVAQDRRTTGTMVEDKTIQIKSMNAIQKIADHDPSIHVNAISYNNRVLLVGEAPSYQIRSELEQTIQKISKVKQVHNEVAIAKPLSPLTHSTDGLITAKIKSEMAIAKNLNPTRVKVITQDGVVYLMGLVKPSEETIAVDIARYTKGVQKVVKLFEYERA